MRRIEVHILLAGIIMLAAFFPESCSKKKTPEMEKAGAALARAREANVRNEHLKSRDLLLAALQQDRSLGRLPQQAQELDYLGDNYAAGAKFDSAVMYYHNALDVYTELAERPLAQELTLKIAGLHRWLGEQRQAYALYAEALRLANVFEEDDAARTIRWSMLPTLRALGKYDEESRLLTELLNGYTSEGDVGKQAKVYYEFGLSHQTRKDYGAAVENYLRALTLADQAHDSLLAIDILMHAATNLDWEGKTPDAFQLFTEGLTRSDVTTGARLLREEMLIRVGNIYLGGAQYGEAQRFYEAALTSAILRGNRISEGYIEIQLGHCERGISKERGAGLKNYQSASDLFRRSGFLQGSAYAAASMGIAHWETKQLTEAEEYLTLAASRLDSLWWHPSFDDLYRGCEEAFFRPRGSSIGDAAIRLLLQAGNSDEAFAQFDARLHEHLYRFLTSLDVHINDTAIAREFNAFLHAIALRQGAERQLSFVLMGADVDADLIKEIRSQLGESIERITSTVERMEERDSSFGQYLRRNELHSSDVQKVLPQESYLVEYYPSNESSFFFITGKNRTWVQLSAAGEQQVETTAQEYWNVLRRRIDSADSSDTMKRGLDRELQSLSLSLYSWFVRPITSVVPEGSHLLMVMPSTCTPVPLHALRREHGRGAYLIERYAISYLPDARALPLRGAVTQPAKDIVALGNPGRTQWDVEYELRDIRAFFKDAKLLFNQQATIASLKKSAGDVLHLAAEFNYDGRHPGTSSTVLSDGESFNGTRVYNWGHWLDAGMFATTIVSNLSEGEKIQPELPLIFMLNGSGNVIVNAIVPARKTKKFFGEAFYTSLLAGANGADAYRQALLTMINTPEYSPSSVWAPYFLWGK